MGNQKKSPPENTEHLSETTKKEELSSYYRFTSKARLDKSINTLTGIIKGITLDAQINKRELSYLAGWVNEHSEYKRKHPFNEIIPVVAEAIKDGILAEDEQQNILWLCNKIISTEYYNEATADIQHLHALMSGIAADGLINEKELQGLDEWVQRSTHLRNCWPYDEVESLITTVLKDKIIDKDEHGMLMGFFGSFRDAMYKEDTIQAPWNGEKTIQGICAMCPDISFPSSLFCFTGVFGKYLRDDLHDMVIQLGGHVTVTVSPSLHYLVVGSQGNPCWAYACYGRKVEKAVQLRKLGHQIVLVHENDFLDAIADQA